MRKSKSSEDGDNMSMTSRATRYCGAFIVFFFCSENLLIVLMA